MVSVEMDDTPSSQSSQPMLPTLSVGFVQTINQDYDTANPPPAIVQVVSIKQTESDRGPRHRLVISDGQYVQQSMLSSSLNPLVENNQINKYTVLQLKKFTVNSVQDSKIIMILDVDVMNSLVDQKIGNPVPYGQSAAPTPSSSSSSSSTSVQAQNRAPSTSPSKPSPSSSPQKQRQPNFAPPSLDLKAPDVYAIPSLNPYQSKWSIKARVSSKSEIKHWDNARGKGRLFSVDFTDDAGEIRATGFNEAVDAFYDLLEVGKIYLVSRGSVKPAKKQFTSVKNEYEIHFDHSTSIVLADDQSAKIPETFYDFVAIPKIANAYKDSVIDVIGIVKEATDPVMTKTKFQKELLKKDITLVDFGGKWVRLTVWGQTLEALNPDEHPVLAVKGVRVSDYNGGISLSGISSSVFKLNPDIAEAHTLRGWFDTAGQDTAFTPLSTGNNTKGFDDLSQRRMIKDIDTSMLTPQQADVVTVKGTVSLIPNDKMFCYPACPESGAKVVQEAQGWYSEKVKKHFPMCDYRYILKFQILDASGGLWMTAFNEPAELIMKKPAADLVLLRDNGQVDAFKGAFQEALFQPFTFRVRSKIEEYQGERYTRHQVLQAKPLDYVADSRVLLSAIAELSK